MMKKFAEANFPNLFLLFIAVGYLLHQAVGADKIGADKIVQNRNSIGAG
jgi:hypothetical protein